MFAYGSENITNQAFWLGYAEMFAHYPWFKNYLHQLEQVTPVEVQRVAQKYLRSNTRVVGHYQPNGETLEVE
jgi:zinc protease